MSTGYPRRLAFEVEVGEPHLRGGRHVALLVLQDSSSARLEFVDVATLCSALGAAACTAAGIS
jgi:hypothetical protein